MYYLFIHFNLFIYLVIYLLIIGVHKSFFELLVRLNPEFA